MKPDNSKAMRYTIARITILTGGFFYYYCLNAHICMCGHMQHLPYSTFDFVADRMWMLFLITATFSALLCRTKKSLISAGILIFLIVNRSLLESNGGMGFMFEIPLLMLSFAMLIPPSWFRGFHRHHIFLPTTFLSMFLVAQILDSFQLMLREGHDWFFCLHPKAFMSPMSIIVFLLVVASNEIMQKTVIMKQKVQPAV